MKILARDLAFLLLVIAAAAMLDSCAPAKFQDQKVGVEIRTRELGQAADGGYSLQSVDAAFEGVLNKEVTVADECFLLNVTGSGIPVKFADRPDGNMCPNSFNGIGISSNTFAVINGTASVDLELAPGTARVADLWAIPKKVFGNSCPSGKVSFDNYNGHSYIYIDGVRNTTSLDGNADNPNMPLLIARSAPFNVTAGASTSVGLEVVKRTDAIWLGANYGCHNGNDARVFYNAQFASIINAGTATTISPIAAQSNFDTCALNQDWGDANPNITVDRTTCAISVGSGLTPGEFQINIKVTKGIDSRDYPFVIVSKGGGWSKAFVIVDSATFGGDPVNITAGGIDLGDVDPAIKNGLVLTLKNIGNSAATPDKLEPDHSWSNLPSQIFEWGLVNSADVNSKYFPGLPSASTVCGGDSLAPGLTCQVRVNLLKLIGEFHYRYTPNCYMGVTDCVRSEGLEIRARVNSGAMPAHIVVDSMIPVGAATNPSQVPVGTASLITNNYSPTLSLTGGAGDYTYEFILVLKNDGGMPAQIQPPSNLPVSMVFSTDVGGASASCVNFSNLDPGQTCIVKLSYMPKVTGTTNYGLGISFSSLDTPTAGNMLYGFSSWMNFSSTITTGHAPGTLTASIKVGGVVKQPTDNIGFRNLEVNASESFAELTSGDPIYLHLERNSADSYFSNFYINTGGGSANFVSVDTGNASCDHGLLMDSVPAWTSCDIPLKVIRGNLYNLSSDLVQLMVPPLEFDNGMRIQRSVVPNKLGIRIVPFDLGAQSIDFGVLAAPNQHSLGLYIQNPKVTNVKITSNIFVNTDHTLADLSLVTGLGLSFTPNQFGSDPPAACVSGSLYFNGQPCQFIYGWSSNPNGPLTGHGLQAKIGYKVNDGTEQFIYVPILGTQ